MDITIVRGFAKATPQSSSLTSTNDDIGTKVIIEGLQEDAVSEFYPAAAQRQVSRGWRGRPPAVPEPAKDKLRHLYNNTPDAERSETPLASYITSASRAPPRPKLDNRAPSPMRLEVRNSVARSPSHRGSFQGRFRQNSSQVCLLYNRVALVQGRRGILEEGTAVADDLAERPVPTDRDCPEVTEAEVGRIQ